MSIGFKIHQRSRTVDAATVEKFKAIAVANISDSMNRMMHGGPRLRPLHAGGALCGVALTVKQRPGDNLLVHAALNRRSRLLRRPTKGRWAAASNRLRRSSASLRIEVQKS